MASYYQPQRHDCVGGGGGGGGGGGRGNNAIPLSIIEEPEEAYHQDRLSSTWTVSDDDDTKLRPFTMPDIKFSLYGEKRTQIIVLVLVLLFVDLVLPFTLFYTLRNLTDIDLETILGITSICLGLTEIVEIPQRAYRLVKHRHKFAPLGQTAKWGMDFLFWFYILAFMIGLVLFTLATSLDQPILWLFLMSPGIVVGFAALTCFISLFPFRLPVRISSDAKGERCKPFVYYIMEDFVGVDLQQTRTHREEVRDRWKASPVFRHMLWDISLWWVVGSVLFIGALAYVTWGLDFDIAFGVSYGLLFAWIGIWAGCSKICIIKPSMERELKWFAKMERRYDV